MSPYFAEPISIDHGEGSYVWDLEGNRYLDCFGGVLTTMIGHNNPAVTAAVQAQAAKVLHTSTLYLSEPMIELAEKIADQSGIPDARVFFTTSGSEANDTAILLATSYRKSNQMLAMRNSYHGRSFTTQAITSHASWSSTSLSGLQVTFVQGAYRLRSPFRDLDDEAFTDGMRRRSRPAARHDLGRRRRRRSSPSRSRVSVGSPPRPTASSARCTRS